MGTVSFAVEIKKVQKLGYIQFLRLDYPILWWVREIRDTWRLALLKVKLATFSRFRLGHPAALGYSHGHPFFELVLISN